MGEDREKVTYDEGEEREKVIAADDDVEGHKLVTADSERALPLDDDVEAHKMAKD
jgi:hypothetical protein